MTEESFVPEPRKPRLIWNGKSRRRVAEPLPTQVVEIVSPQHADVRAMDAVEAFRREQAEQSRLPGMRGAVQATLGVASCAQPLPPNRLIWTNDNLTALTALLHGDDQHEPLEGKVDLIYIDPPFAVQSDFGIDVEIENGVVDEKTPTLIEELAYTDTWQNGLDSYLSMMRDRLELLRELLAPTGSIYVHCDWHAAHYLKLVLDEVFGYENLVNEIIWTYGLGNAGGHRAFARKHDTLLLYGRSADYQFNRQRGEVTAAMASKYRHVDEDGQQYMLSYGRKYTLKGGKPLSTVWEIPSLAATAEERRGFPTQKPVALLQRIIAASSNPGDVVLDSFVGSGTTAIAAESMTDEDGSPAPRRWIAVDCGKFAIHITRKRLIEAGARPFAVENVGFYARGNEWRDLWAERPQAKVYRDAMVTIYGGEPMGGYAHLHGRKGNHWVHVGPLDAPVATQQVEAVLAEAAGTELKAVDLLSADIPIDFNRSEAEERYGVRLFAKVIPAAAVEAVRDRLKRKNGKDKLLEEGPAIHFFSPPDVEVGVTVGGESATVKLLRLTVDLDDCLSTQDAAKRAQITARITDWRALVDYWAVDWDYKPGEPFRNDWQSFRTRKNREIAMQATNSYGHERGEKLIAVKVTDVFGNDGLKVARVVIG